MIYGSVCSGIEAASVAWRPLGWRASFLSEIEAFPRAVLQHHYPEVPLHGDFTTIRAGEYDPIDLLVGGTPCQSFSVAGLRGGLDDDRGNLALEYLRLADRLRPRWLVWENVPGVLSSNGGRDFGAILGGMVELGYGFAYRVLDAQFFGVAQRRRRVFVVGYLGDWRRAAAVLFERHSLSGHPAPRREAGKAAPTIPSRSSAGGGLGTDFDCDGGLISTEEVADTLAVGANQTTGFQSPSLVASTGSIAHCLNAGGMGRQDYETETLIAHTLKGEGFDASEDGTGRGTPIVPVHAIQERAVSTNMNAGPQGAGHQEGIAYTLEARNRVQAVAFALRGREGGAMPEVCENGSVGTLRAADGGSSRDYVATVAPTLRAGGNATGGDRPYGTDVDTCESLLGGSAVRRLTPRECERLQGFPDDYTLIPYRKGQAADRPRYKALGNSMAVPVMRWIGERIAKVDAIPHTQIERSAT